MANRARDKVIYIRVDEALKKRFVSGKWNKRRIEYEND